MAGGTSLDLTGYKLTFDDEFNAFSSNGPSNPYVAGGTGTWDTTLSYGERRLNDEAELYSDPTIGVNPDSIVNGVLDINAAPSTDLTASQGRGYTSGIITSYHSFSQEYGYFEMRAELPEGVGMWPAFWLLPQAHVYPPELDPLEAYGSASPYGVAGAYLLHSGAIGSATGGQGSWLSTNGANLYTQYNTFGVDWQPNTITFYLNGVATLALPTPAGFDQPMYMLADLAVGGNSPGPAIGETGDLKIDYIRAFSSNGYNPAISQQGISSPDGRGYDFHGATDANGNGALGGVDAPAPAPTGPTPVTAPAGDQTVGSGAQALRLQISEDADLGDAQFIVAIDGAQVGGVLATSAIHGSAAQAFNIRGNFGPGPHTAEIYFLNDTPEPGPIGAPVDAPFGRNLYLEGATLDGTAIPGAVLNEYLSFPQSFSFIDAAVDVNPAPGTSAGAGADTVLAYISEDAWLGDAQFTISVDGQQVGGVQTATALHADTASQIFAVHGDFGLGTHDVGVQFINDAWGGSPSTDRNLYVDAVSFDGHASATPPAALYYSNSIAYFATAASPLVLQLSEDAYQGDAQFTVAVDGKALGPAQSVTALHASGASQNFAFDLGVVAGTHDVAVSFLNDAWGGSAQTDRNLYVDAILVNGAAAAGAAAALLSTSTRHFSVFVAAGS